MQKSAGLGMRFANDFRDSDLGELGKIGHGGVCRRIA